MEFMNALKNESVSAENNVSFTENGMRGFRTSGNALLDMNFAVSSLRRRSARDVEAMFVNALAENFDLAVVWLFFARDVRGGGMGERRLFRICFSHLMKNYPDRVIPLLKLIPEYGRWDDLVEMYFTAVESGEDQCASAIISIIAGQLNVDLKSLADWKSVSLLAKWMPSENTSSKVTRSHARRLAAALGVSPKKYRQSLSALRRRADIVERRMSAGDWGGIDYEAVPSKANLLYREAFLSHDPERRKAYLKSLRESRSKINASVLFPHEIAGAYRKGAWYISDELDDTLEALWKNLPNVFPENAPATLVVADGSGSMTCRVSLDSGVMAMDVANAMAIYFAERLPGAYHNRYVTFSSHPEFVDFSGVDTLREKLTIAMDHDECSRTNVRAVFSMVLDTAVKNHMKQEELPEIILIISDMEFDAMAENATTNDFTVIQNSYASMGYQVPKLCFWNVASRSLTIPVMNNDRGVTLVSGFSPSVVRMVMGGELDPFCAMEKILNGDRYTPVRRALQ